MVSDELIGGGLGLLMAAILIYANWRFFLKPMLERNRKMNKEFDRIHRHFEKGDD